MEISDEVKQKPSSPARDQNNTRIYPDWTMMQAYYGPRLAVPPYLNSAVSSAHAPLPCMWLPPQSMIHPYGSPYTAFYANGGVYGHSGIPTAGAACSTETPVKPEGGFMEKLKEFDGLAMSIGNGNADSDERETDHRLSDSEETEGSSDGVEAETGQSSKKKSRQESPNSAGDGKAQIPSAEVGSDSERMIKMIHPAHTPSDKTKAVLELNEPSDLNVQPYLTRASQPSNLEIWFEDEHELKWEKRKQSNRESARRSRLRKQAETEELTTEVQKLTTENMTLKSEINKLKKSSKRLKHENTALMEEIQDAPTDEVRPRKSIELRMKPFGTANLLYRVDNNDSTDRRNEDAESSGNRSPVGKLCQLLDASPKTDTVAAR